jgi:integrase
MAYAEKRNSALTGMWLGEVTLRKSNQRFKRSFDTKKEAEAYEAFVRMMHAEPPTILEGRAVAAKGRSFRELAKECRAQGGPNGAWLRSRDPSGMRRLEWCIEQLGDYDIGDVTRSLIREKIVENLQRRPGRKGRLSQATINRYLAAASAVLHWAVNEERISTKPTLPFVNNYERTERGAVSFADEERIVQHLEQQGYRAHALCVRWLVWTGMRRGELFKLKPEQIKTDHIVLQAFQTKANRTRTVYVRPSQAREMRALVASGSLPDPAHLSSVFKAAAKAVGTESCVVLHSLRHTFATRLMNAGVRREIAQYMLGHTTRDVHDGYVHVALDAQREAIEKLVQMRGDLGGQVVDFNSHTHSQPVDIAQAG